MPMKMTKHMTLSKIVASTVSISVKNFFRLMTPTERRMLRRSNTDEVLDLIEDLQRSPEVVLDAVLEQQILDTGIFTQDRIDELLS